MIMTSRRPGARTLAAAATLALGLPLLAACTDNAPAAGDDAGDPRALTVTATDTSCDVSGTGHRPATCGSR
jgi:iron uptake system component EfeO